MNLAKAFLFGGLITLLQPAAAQTPVSLSDPGAFVVGCNYWASHAGINMWSDWKPAVVEADFKQLAAANIRVIRVFPVWPYFQPIYAYYGGEGQRKEIRFKDEPLPDKGPASYGVSPEALAEFRALADMAAKYDLKLVVGLVTGWMSGRLLVPPALEGKKILSDPFAVMWQVRYVRAFVNALKDHPAIIAWDLGNECNVLEDVDESTAYSWTASIANAILAVDATRPVVSGMHGLSPAPNAAWQIQDQAELTDILTTHPYPMWTPYAGQDAKNAMRTCMHAVAESRLYADVAGKPCMAEEIGIMGPMEASDSITAAFARTALFGLWANDCHGFMWWCAYDQDHLSFPPYEWQAVERDLGLFRADRSPKPVSQQLKKFSAFLKELPFKKLPVRNTNAVCILTEGQDQWAVAYSTYILAKQAGIELSFQYASQPLKPSGLYLLPSINGTSPITRQQWLHLLEKVRDGAVLYVSCNEGFLAPFNTPAGINILSRQTRTGNARFTSRPDTTLHFETSSASRFTIQPVSAKVLAAEPDDNPVFTVNQWGKGSVYFLTVPIENNLSNTPGAFGEQAAPWWKFYKTLAEQAAISPILADDNPFVSVTEHQLSATERLIIAINYSTADQVVRFRPFAGQTTGRTLYGGTPVNGSYTIRANDALVLTQQIK